MYVLYYAPSTAALAVHWMLIELKVPFELVALDFDRREQKSAAYLAINPSGHVPALIVDGRPHAECAALLMLLAERHPEAGFAPPIGAPGRADYLQWMVYLANTLQPAYRAWFYPDEPPARRTPRRPWPTPVRGSRRDWRGWTAGSPTGGPTCWASS